MGLNPKLTGENGRLLLQLKVKLHLNLNNLAKMPELFLQKWKPFICGLVLTHRTEV